MTKTEKTIPGTWYTLTSTAPATVTQQIAGQTATLATLTESGTATFRATATTITIETTGNYHILPTKAPAAGNLSSGGNTNLTPADIASLNQSAADIRSAIQTLEHTPNTTQNNTYTATNTFNGALVANDSLFYKQQELGDLLNYPVAAWLIENGLHPASALAKSWDEWVGLNPGWESMESLLFYAPLMQGESIPAFEHINTPFSQCTFISPANVSNSNSQYLLSKNITLYSLKEGICGDVYNCYNVKKCFFYVPKVTEFRHALNAVGYSNLGVELELSIYAPQLRDIYLNGINTSFWRLGLLKSFSIHAPMLVKSFSFSMQTDSGSGQTCAILHALVAGIGTPDTLQTITTITPSDGTDETISALQAAAAAKNWQFEFV